VRVIECVRVNAARVTLQRLSALLEPAPFFFIYERAKFNCYFRSKKNWERIFFCVIFNNSGHFFVRFFFLGREKISFLCMC
jgi:hypothetical protein